MNPHHNSNQNPATSSTVQQVNSGINQQICNGNVGGLFPNNRPIVAPSGFMNFPNQPFPLHNTTGQFINGIGEFNPQQNFNPFPVNQFSPSQQQQGQFFAHNSMNPAAFNQNVGLSSEQVIMQNTIQNICQLLQLQNPNNAQCPPGGFPMFQNQIGNVMSQPNPGFLVNNAQFVLGNYRMFQNQIAQGVGPQNQSFLTNQLFGMANSNGPVQLVNQGQQGFVSPMMDVNASRQMVNTGQQGNLLLPHSSATVQTQNPCPAVTKFEDNPGNVPTNVNGGWADSQHKNFAGHKKNDPSHKGFKSQFRHAKHVKEKFGIHNGNMNKEGNSNATVDSGPRNSTKFEKKVPSLKYTEQEIKQWREARKKHYPTSATVEKKCKKQQTLCDVTNQEAILRRQQLKEILAKQAELGCEVAEIPSSYLSVPDKQNPRVKRHERGEPYKKDKFHNKRRTRFQKNRTAKKTRRGDKDSFRANNQTNEPKEASLLQKLLTRDIKRDKSHLLQVFRFMAVNSFFNGESSKSLRFPNVIVKETGQDVPEVLLEEEEEGEITD